MVIAYASLGLIAYFVYRLGALWFDRSIGAVAAAIVLTRAPFLSNGLRAYVDLPYIALCLGALAARGASARAPAGRSWRCWSRPACCAPRPGSSPSPTGCGWPAIDADRAD